MILRNRVRSDDTKPDTIYIEMTNPARLNEYLADLHHLRHALKSPFSFYGQVGWHINSTWITKSWPQEIFNGNHTPE